MDSNTNRYGRDVWFLRLKQKRGELQSCYPKQEAQLAQLKVTQGTGGGEQTFVSGRPGNPAAAHRRP